MSIFCTRSSSAVPLVPPRPLGVPSKGGPRPVALFQPQPQAESQANSAAPEQSSQHAFKSPFAADHAPNAKGRSARQSRAVGQGRKTGQGQAADQAQAAVPAMHAVPAVHAESSREADVAQGRTAVQSHQPASIDVHSEELERSGSTQQESADESIIRQPQMRLGSTAATRAGSGSIQPRQDAQDEAASSDVLTTYSSFGHDLASSYQSVAATAAASSHHDFAVASESTDTDQQVAQAQSSSGPVFSSPSHAEDLDLSTFDDMTELQL